MSLEGGRRQGERAYLHFGLHLIPRGNQVIQRLLSVLHVTAVLSIDQQPERNRTEFTPPAVIKHLLFLYVFDEAAQVARVCFAGFNKAQRLIYNNRND